jgi:hypothetical protein
VPDLLWGSDKFNPNVAMIGAGPASAVHAGHGRVGRIERLLPRSSGSQRLIRRPRTVRGAAGLEHPFWLDGGTSSQLDHSL